MSISIAPELAVRIERLAANRGIGVDDYVAVMLIRVIEDEEGEGSTPFPLTPDEELKLQEGIRLGDEAVASGRTRPAREFFADLESKYGSSLE